MWGVEVRGYGIMLIVVRAQCQSKQHRPGPCRVDASGRPVVAAAKTERVRTYVREGWKSVRAAEA